MEALIRELTTNNRELQQENEKLLAGREQDLRLIKAILLQQPSKSITITDAEIYNLENADVKDKNVAVTRGVTPYAIIVELESGEYVHERVQ